MRCLKQLLAHERVIATPHLGASTEEAQVGVATDVAEQIVSVLRGGFPRAAVNAPLILPETLKVLQPYMHLVEQMGRLYTQLQPGPLSKIELSCSGDIANYDLRPLQAALIKGLLESVSDAHVNMINAQIAGKAVGTGDCRAEMHDANRVRQSGDAAHAECQRSCLVLCRQTRLGDEHVEY